MKNRFDIGYTFTVLVASCWIFFSNFGQPLKPVAEATEMATFVDYRFAFCINPTHNSQLVTFSVVGVQDEKVVSVRNITQTNFILQAMGHQQSGANPRRENFFDHYNLSDCLYRIDSITDPDELESCYINDLFTLDHLWALRYARNPMCPEGCTPKDGMRMKGWAGTKFNPTWPQLQILQQYGVTYVTDLFYGENMFRLLQDIEDPQWVETYQTAGVPEPDTTSTK